MLATSSTGPVEVVSAAGADEPAEAAPVFSPSEADSDQILVSGVVQTCPYPGGNCPQTPPPPPSPVCSFSVVEKYTYQAPTNDIAAALTFTASDGCRIGISGAIRVSGASGELGRGDGSSSITVGVTLPCSPDKRSYTVEALNSSDELIGSQQFSLGPPAGTCPMTPVPAPDPAATIAIVSISSNCSAATPSYTVEVSGTANIPAVLVEAFAGADVGRATLEVVNGSYSGTLTVPADPGNDGGSMTAIPHVPDPFEAIGTQATSIFTPCP